MKQLEKLKEKYLGKIFRLNVNILGEKESFQVLILAQNNRNGEKYLLIESGRARGWMPYVKACEFAIRVIKTRGLPKQDW